MSAPEQTGAPRYADLDDRTLADALAREDDMDGAWNAGGNPGDPPRRDTCHPCQAWADHRHDPIDGSRIELEPADLDDQRDRAMERAVLADMAHDPDEAAWSLYERLHVLDEQRGREGAARQAQRVVDRSWQDHLEREARER